MLSILQNNMKQNNMINIFNFNIDPFLVKLIKSDSSIQFEHEINKNIPWDYNTIIYNLERIREIEEYRKFYFDNNFVIQENYNILGFTYTTSLYRKMIGLNRDKSFDNLKTFIVVIEKFLKKCNFIKALVWNKFAYDRVNNIFLKLKESKNGLNNLKITYSDDKKTIVKIDYLIKKIDSLFFT